MENQKTSPNQAGQKLVKKYEKSNSFVSISGTNANLEQIQRLRKIALSLETVPKDIQTIVGQACFDALNCDENEIATFKLYPHVVEEMRRLSDSELPRYLFYRYRYDIYPIRQKLDKFPPCVQIEPTSICNYRCVFCYQTDPKLTQGRHGHMGMMDLNTFKTIIDQIYGNVEAVTLASRGEPLMAKEIISMLEYLSGKFIGLKINTNASFLSEAKAHAILSAEPNTLVFSADAADEVLYSKLRVNGSLNKVLSNIERFNKIKEIHYPKSKTITRVSGVKFSSEQEFNKIDGFWNNYVDQVAFVSYNPWENAYEAENTQITEHCSDLWRRTFIWWDGLVNPCDVDYRSMLAVGNIKNQSLSDLWRGPKYQALRSAHTDGQRCKLNPCKGCVVI